MVRRSIIGILFLCTLSFLVAAQDVPTVIQPHEGDYSPLQLTNLKAAINRLQVVLGNTSLGSKKQLGVSGWGLETFAAYTAGSLERLGYQVSIVAEQAEDISFRTWVLVLVDLDGAIAWIPVEPLPNIDIYQQDLGEVPMVGAYVYDSRYLSYDAVVELPPNIPPVAVIRNPMQDVVETRQSPWFGNTSSDPDGEVVLFQWTFGEEAQRITHTISVWYTFEVGGIVYPVSLTVIDNRGAQATTSSTVYVLTLAEEEANHCGCGGD